jgi:hypothetical protein
MQLSDQTSLSTYLLSFGPSETDSHYMSSAKIFFTNIGFFPKTRTYLNSSSYSSKCSLDYFLVFEV